jgi:hypothetical protein
VLRALEVPAADDCLELGIHEQVGQPLSGGVDPVALEDGGDFLAGEPAASLQGGGEPRPTAGACALVETELAVPRSVLRLHARSGEL